MTRKSGTTQSRKRRAPNSQNLIPVKTTEEARERGRAGGKASGESRREKSNFRKAVMAIIGEVRSDGKGKEMSVLEAIVASQVKKALAGDTVAYKALEASAGQQPGQKIDLSGEIDIGVQSEKIAAFLRGGKPNEK